MITIVNKKTHIVTKYDYYIGRPSALGNPYPVNTWRDRKLAITSYENWLEDMIKDDRPSVEAALLEILRILKVHGKVNLVCWCSPDSCHGDIIKKHLESLLVTKLD